MSFFASFNESFENFFDSLGQKIAKYPWLIFGAVVVILYALTGGVVMHKNHDNIILMFSNPDSQIHAEIDFVDEHYGPVLPRDIVFLVTPRDGGNVVTRAYLKELERLTNIFVNDIRLSHKKGNDANASIFSWYDLCDRPSSVPLPPPFPKGTFLNFPCSANSPLMCWKEGGFDKYYQDTIFQMITYVKGGAFNPYANAPSYMNENFTLFSAIEKKCYFWSGSNQVERDLIFGGVNYQNPDDSTGITSVAGMESIFRLKNPRKLAKEQGISIDEADDILFGFELEFIDKFKVLARDSTQFDIAYFAFEGSVKELVDEAFTSNIGLIAGGYICMIIFVVLSQMRMPRSSKMDFTAVLVGVVGVLIVLGSVLCTMGLVAIFGLTYAPAVTQILPFLALGLGVDDMFVVAASFKFDSTLNVPDMCGSCLRIAGASISLTSLINTIAFGIGATIPIPAVNILAIAAMLAVIINYFAILFGFTALLAIWARRLKKNKKKSDVTTAGVNSQTDLTDGKSKERKVSCVKPLPFPVCIGVQYVMSAIIFGFAIYGSLQTGTGLALSEIIPTDSYVHPFLLQREAYYNSYPNYLYCGMSADGQHEFMDYPNKIGEIIALEAALQSASFADKEYPVFLTSWIDLWLLDLNSKTNETQKLPYLDQNKPYFHPVASKYGLDFKLFKREMFYKALENFLRTPLGQYFREYIKMYNNTNYDGNGASRMEIHSFFTRINAKPLVDTNDFVTYLKETREMIEASGLPCFMQGWVYEGYDQYLNIEGYMLKNLGFVILAVFCVSFVFLYNPIAVLIMTITIAKCVFEIYGFLYYFGIKMNADCVVNQIVAAGITIEFMAHLTRAYVISEGKTKIERVHHALDEMGVPVMLGGVSTFLGVAWTAGSHFPYFKVYYFYNFLLIVLMGLFNAFFFLLPTLALCGPESIKSNKKGDDVTMSV